MISSEEGEKQRTNVEYRESNLRRCCHPNEKGSGKRRRRGSLGRKELDSEMTTKGDSDFAMKKGCFWKKCQHHHLEVVPCIPIPQNNGHTPKPNQYIHIFYKLYIKAISANIQISTLDIPILLNYTTTFRVRLRFVPFTFSKNRL